MRALLLFPMIPSLLAVTAPLARADMWCATPIWAHEWGVHVYASDGTALSTTEGLPDWFHGADRPSPDAPAPVRSLPADNGARKLPVVHFYAPEARPIPVGVEVGFTAGPAAAWFPAVDLLRSAREANSDAAKEGLVTLRSMRLARQDGRRETSLPPDPTKQLVWDRLALAEAPATAPRATDVDWIARARALPARWVSREGESERFLFYEASSAEPLPLRLRRAPGWTATRRAYVLENRGAHAVHDVVMTHEDRGATWVFSVDTIPAGGEATFVLDDLRVKDRRAATWERLRASLVDAEFPNAPREPYPSAGPCVMGRDPAIPFERADGHRLFAGEVDLLLSYWGERFFDRPGTTIVWREDAATLDAVMPLSIYTDMYHYVLLRRAGLALWERVRLP